MNKKEKETEPKIKENISKNEPLFANFLQNKCFYKINQLY